MKSILQIAVADDEADMRDYLKVVLERLGHRVLGPVEDGHKLVDLCRQQRPDLVITDIRMPGLNGDDAIREICRTDPVPCVLLSAVEKGTIAALDGAAKCTFLAKPFRKSDLYEAISRLMMS